MKTTGLFVLSTIFISNVMAVLSCSCDGVSTALTGTMCACGCKEVDLGYKKYIKECPILELAKLDSEFSKKCDAIENTEDCEYFKQLDGELTDLYKDCRDKLDSVLDDCEECDKRGFYCKV